jgi:hypothetical protein
MTHEEIIKMLLDNGFETGWVLQGTILVLWEHDTEPPTPLKRPKNA